MIKKIYYLLVVLSLFAVAASCINTLNPPTTGDPEQPENLPPVLTIQTFWADESIGATDIIGQVIASDPESNILTYSISTNDNNLFEIAIDNGSLSLASGRWLDFERSNRHIISVQVFDGELTAAADITINVQNVNEPPIITNRSFFVNENITPVEIIAQIIAFDPENDTLTYSILTNDNNLFEIAIDNGSLSLASGQSLDFERNNRHSITVQVFDGRLFSIVEITINVADANESPIIVAGQSFSIRKDRTVGSLVGQVQASDVDGSIQSFQITEGNTGSHFSIDDSGNIQLANVFNPTTDNRRLKIRVVDDDGATVEENVDINIIESFILTNQSFSIRRNNETNPVDTVSFSQSITQIQSISIVSGNTENVFSIDNQGVIRIIGTIDYGLGQYRLAIKAVINDGRAFRQEVLIDLQDIFFTNQSWNFQVNEFSPTDTVVGQVQVFDSNQVQSFNILNPSNSLPFGINDDGEILVRSLVDYDVSLSYTFTISAGNSNEANDTSTVNISVQEIGSDTVNDKYWPLNDFPLVFSIGEGFNSAERTSIRNVTTNGVSSWNNLVGQNLFTIADAITTNGVTFDYLAASPDNVMGVYKIEEGWPTNRSGLLAIAINWRRNENISVHSDVIFNYQDYNWVTEGVSATQASFIFDEVLTHEFGHVLGLNHETNVSGISESIMYPSGTPVLGLPPAYGITTLDLGNIQKLYRFGIDGFARTAALRLRSNNDDLVLEIIHFKADGTCIHHVMYPEDHQR